MKNINVNNIVKALVLVFMIGGFLGTAHAINTLANINVASTPITQPAVTCIALDGDVLNAPCFDRYNIRVGNYKEVAFSYGSVADQYIELKEK